MHHTELALDAIWHNDCLDYEDAELLMIGARILVRHLHQLFAPIEVGCAPSNADPDKLVHHAVACVADMHPMTTTLAHRLEHELKHMWDSLFAAVQRDRMETWQARQMYLQFTKGDVWTGKPCHDRRA